MSRLSHAQPSPQPLSLDQSTYAQAQSCVHCGLCLPACPTYAISGLEADSPRGRIYLIKALADGRVTLTDSVEHHLDLCLNCRACETACPSGVVYHQLIDETRHHQAQHNKARGAQALVNWFVLHILPHPLRLRVAMLGPRIAQRLGLWGPMTLMAARLLPQSMQKLLQMLPPRGPLWDGPLARKYPAMGTARHRVGFFSGCVSSVLQQSVNRKAIELLQLCGCDVLVPHAQRCCGAIHHHVSRTTKALAMARRNIAAFDNVDQVITCTAGCGAMLKEYAHLLRHDPRWARRAELFSAKVVDISQALHDYDPGPPRFELRAIATYHDACHLAHAQGVTQTPRDLLRAIPGLVLRKLEESDMCCGAAGTYNLQQPQMSRGLAQRKLRHLADTGAQLCITSNIGCAMQIQSQARQLGIQIEVRHPVEMIHAAYFGPD